MLFRDQLLQKTFVLARGHVGQIQQRERRETEQRPIKTHGQEDGLFFVISKMVLMLFFFLRNVFYKYYAYTVKIHGPEDGLSFVISKLVWMIRTIAHTHEGCF